ncbi:MAG TPA: hypothetical protein VM598_12475 [Bdellovibrionota bacterium]|nr:hypothetical protein [Bdellovibrionota bacterium]
MRFLALLLLSTQALADELPIRASVDGWFGARYEDTSESAIDPTNRTLAIPRFGLFGDLRAGGKADLGAVQLSARLREEIVRGRVHFLSPAESIWDTETEFMVIDASATWTVNDYLILSAGGQNYQWGPAELLSPSNTIFHFIPGQRTLRWIEPARWIGRANLSVGSSWSLVAMIEALEQKESTFIADVPFKPIALLKAEYRAETGNHYVGATASQTVSRMFHWGEYGSYSILEGFSVYGDLRHSVGSESWYPVVNPDTTISMLQSERDSDDLFTLAIFGLRFEDRVDARIEYVHNDYGYSSTDQSRALQGIRVPSPQLPSNFLRLLAPGLEMPSRDVIYASVRVPDLGPAKELAVTGRYLLSLTDRSGAAGATGEWLLSDNASFFADLAYNHDGEMPGFASIVSADLSGGIRLQF